MPQDEKSTVDILIIPLVDVNKIPLVYTNKKNIELPKV
jgi:hypothetical protein